MITYLWDRLVIGKVAITVALLATPALAFDSHPPLRDDGARWAAANLPTPMPRPAEDRGINVVTLGMISEASLVQQTGLAGHVLRLSAVTLAPGGQVAAQGTAGGPGLLVVTGGEWTVGAPGIERVHTALVAPTLSIGSQARWYFNRGAVPATALVVEVTPSAETDVGG
jgi:hypothetical protein